MTRSPDAERPPAGDAPPRGPDGLCPSCRHVRVVRSPRGSRFLLCGLAGADPRFRKYPPQPVVVCPGWRR